MALGFLRQSSVILKRGMVNVLRAPRAIGLGDMEPASPLALQRIARSVLWLLNSDVCRSVPFLPCLPPAKIRQRLEWRSTCV